MKRVFVPLIIEKKGEVAQQIKPDTNCLYNDSLLI